MRTKTSDAVFDYWNKLRGERIAPHRFEIEPAHIASLLPHTFILEKLKPGQFRYRLAGTRVCEKLGQDLKGSDFLAPWTPAHQKILTRRLTTVTTGGAIVRFDICETPETVHTPHVELLLLPLTHGGDQITRVLGALSTTQDFTWAQTGPIRRPQLIKSDVVWTSQDQHEKPMFAEPPTFEPTVRHARIVRQDRRQFRVYDGGLSLLDTDKS